MLPGSSPERIEREAARGRQSGRTQEIQRLIGRALRAVTDLEAMAEIQITLDCDVLQADGGTRTASICGAYVALHDACTRLLRLGKLRAHPVREACAAVSVGIVDALPMLDLAYRGGQPGGSGHERGDDGSRAVRRGPGHRRGHALHAAASSTAFSAWPSRASRSFRRCRRRCSPNPRPGGDRRVGGGASGAGASGAAASGAGASGAAGASVAGAIGHGPRMSTELVLVLASANPDKVREIQSCFSSALDVTLLPCPRASRTSSRTARRFSTTRVIEGRGARRGDGRGSGGDDTGLEVEALGGVPGRPSARYAGNRMPPTPTTSTSCCSSSRGDRHERPGAALSHRCPRCLPRRLRAVGRGNRRRVHRRLGVWDDGFRAAGPRVRRRGLGRRGRAHLRRDVRRGEGGGLASGRASP